MTIMITGYLVYQIMRTDTVAPMTSARCHPKLIFFVAGLEATQMAKSEIMKEAKSVRRWAASVAIAWGPIQ